MPSDIHPDVRRWEFTDRDGVARTYEQQELTLDGEVQLFALLGRTIGRLKEADFPFERVGSIFPDDEESMAWDWGTAGELLSIAMLHVPLLASEAAAIMCGLFPFDEHGRRNPDYDVEVGHLRKSFHIADVVEMLETFVQQNDIERLRAPFVRTLSPMWARALTTGADSVRPSISSSGADTARPARSGATPRGRSSTKP